MCARACLPWFTLLYVCLAALSAVYKWRWLEETSQKYFNKKTTMTFTTPRALILEINHPNISSSGRVPKRVSSAPPAGTERSLGGHRAADPGGASPSSGRCGHRAQHDEVIKSSLSDHLMSDQHTTLTKHTQHNTETIRAFTAFTHSHWNTSQINTWVWKAFRPPHSISLARSDVPPWCVWAHDLLRHALWAVWYRQVCVWLTWSRPTRVIKHSWVQIKEWSHLKHDQTGQHLR